MIGKHLKNSDVIVAAENLHKEGIPVRTCNLLGIPGATLENEYETITLNQKIRAEFPHPFIFYPFPKTKLAQIAADQGLFSQKDYEEKKIKSFHDGSILNIKHKAEIDNLHKLFQLVITFPFLTPLSKEWVKHRHPIINKIIFKIMLFVKFKKFNNVSWSRSILNLFR